LAESARLSFIKLPAIYNASAKDSGRSPTKFRPISSGQLVTGLATERIEGDPAARVSHAIRFWLSSRNTRFFRTRRSFRDRRLSTSSAPASRSTSSPSMSAQDPRRDNQIAVAFSVGFDYEDPSTALQVANELVTLVLNEDIRARTASATETTKFLGDAKTSG